MITRFAGLSNEELLAEVEKARAYSPVIEELALRLERGMEYPNEETNHCVSCPVCEAVLEADLDIGNNLFELRIQK